MSVRASLLAIVSTTAVALGMAVPALAEPAVLVGQITGSHVNVRSQPSTQASSPHYGLVGDQVEVLDQTTARDGYVWFYVEFRSGARGWVRGDLVRLLQVDR